MTQAFNLSQFANFLNTSGQISLSGSGITGVLPVANGGTGTSTPSLVGGTNITISGSFPNQTISFSGSAGLSGAQVAVFDANGTWTVPSGVTQARVTVIGAGGGGGATGGYGGMGGQVCVDLTGLSGSYSITIGTGGTGNSNSSQRATSGNASSFGSIITCNGGQGGIAGTPGVTGSATVNAGTIVRQITGVTPNLQNYDRASINALTSGSCISPGTGGSPQAWSKSSQYMAGLGGTFYNLGATGGAVVIEY